MRPLEARDCEALVVTPRFAVRQLSNSGKWKTRVIDDLKASRVNETISLSGVYRPEPIECLLGAAKCWAKADPSAKLKVWSIDFEGAYKHIPLNESENDVSHIVLFNPFENKPYVAKLNALPFGSSLSPAGWGRCVLVLQKILENSMRIPCMAYIDDVFGVASEATADADFTGAIRLAEALGFKLAKDKKAPPSTAHELLGAALGMGGEGVEAKLPPQKRDALLQNLQSFLDKGRMSPAEASKIRGKLGFAASLLYGRTGRGVTSALIERQYTKDKSHRLNKPIELTIAWWKTAIEQMRPKFTPYNTPQPTLLYSDAEGGGHLGCVLIRNGQKISFSGHMAAWMSEADEARPEDEITGKTREPNGRRDGIHHLELAAVLLAIVVGAREKPGPLLVFVDNSSALASLIRGRSSTALGTIICLAVWRFLAETGAYPFFEWVPSASNPADEPSRACPIVHDSLPCEFKALMGSFETLSNFALWGDRPQAPTVGFTCPMRGADPKCPPGADNTWYTARKRIE